MIPSTRGRGNEPDYSRSRLSVLVAFCPANTSYVGAGGEPEIFSDRRRWSLPEANQGMEDSSSQPYLDRLWSGGAERGASTRSPSAVVELGDRAPSPRLERAC